MSKYLSKKELSKLEERLAEVGLDPHCANTKSLWLRWLLDGYTVIVQRQANGKLTLSAVNTVLACLTILLAGCESLPTHPRIYAPAPLYAPNTLPPLSGGSRSFTPPYSPFSAPYYVPPPPPPQQDQYIPRIWQTQTGLYFN